MLSHLKLRVPETGDSEGRNFWKERSNTFKNVKGIFIILFSAVSFYSFGQKETILGQEVERVFRTRDSTQNFYLALAPKSSIKGLLVILRCLLKVKNIGFSIADKMLNPLFP